MPPASCQVPACKPQQQTDSRTNAYLEEIAQDGHLGVVYTTPTVDHIVPDDRVTSHFLE